MPVTKVSSLEEIIKLCSKCLKAARIPLFSGKFSKRTYTQHQHFLLLVLKTYLRLDYRRICEVAAHLPLKFSKAPHFTTLQKFFRRTSASWLSNLMKKLTGFFRVVDYGLADSTGFSSSHASKYFIQHIYGGKWTRGFIKASLLVDGRRHLILGSRIHLRPSADIKDFLPLLKCKKRFNHVAADKAYDSEANLRFVKDELHAEALIPLRCGCTTPVHTKYRKRLHREWLSDTGIERRYHQRSIAESVIFSVKRRFGEYVASRSWRLRKKEVQLRLFVYDLDKLVALPSEEFYKAHGSDNL
jgi:hypothetical protein